MTIKTMIIYDYSKNVNDDKNMVTYNNIDKQ
jgi:hypothetical protein